MPRALRAVSDRVLWFSHGRCFRFAYRDPYTQKREFLMCVPERFRDAGIKLPSPDVIRRDTKVGLEWATKLRDRFLTSLDAVVSETSIETVPTVTGAIDEFFEMYDDQDPGYRKTLRSIFESFRDVAGGKGIDEVRDIDLKRYERSLNGLTRATVRSYIKQLFMLINFAVRKGWVRQDPRLTYKIPREQLREPNPFTRAELTRFFDLCREADGRWDHIEWAGLGLLTLGLRPVELMHARWENVNADERMLWVDKSHGAKERQARQHQPIPISVWPEFERRREESGLIWTNSRGNPMTRNGMNRMRATVAKQLPGFQWKRFRKTYATILAEAGNDGLIVSRLLRHSLGGKAASIAQRHYVGQDVRRLRDLVDTAFGDLEYRPRVGVEDDRAAVG